MTARIDLWDASDVSATALLLAREAHADDVVAETSAFLASRRQESGAADVAV